MANTSIDSTFDVSPEIETTVGIIVFLWKNAPGTEAEDKPLTLADFNDSCSEDTWIPEHYMLKYDSHQLNSVSDIANQSQKLGVRLFKQVRLFSKIWYIMCQKTQ